MQRLDLVGKRFGYLVAVKDNGTTYFSNREWLCQCDCGSTIVVPSAKLTSGHTRSCGCLRKQTTSKRRSKRPYEALYNTMVNNTIHEVSLTYEEFLEFTKVSVCHYCDSTVFWKKHNCSVGSCGYNLDRKDNSKGYTKANCLVCCGVCNRMKGTMPYKDFLEHVANIHRNRKLECLR